MLARRSGVSPWDLWQLGEHCPQLLEEWAATFEAPPADWHSVREATRAQRVGRIFNGQR